MVVIVDGSPLTIADVVAVAHRSADVETGPDLSAPPASFAAARARDDQRRGVRRNPPVHGNAPLAVRDHP